MRVNEGAAFLRQFIDVGGGRFSIGVIALDIAAATYAVFQTTLGDIGSEDFSTWLAAEGLERDASKPHFDFHPPGTTEAFNGGEDPVISVWIPAKHK